MIQFRIFIVRKLVHLRGRVVRRDSFDLLVWVEPRLWNQLRSQRVWPCLRPVSGPDFFSRSYFEIPVSCFESDESWLNDDDDDVMKMCCLSAQHSRCQESFSSLFTKWAADAPTVWRQSGFKLLSRELLGNWDVTEPPGNPGISGSFQWLWSRLKT